MSLTPQFSDALASHFPTSNSVDRSSSAAAPFVYSASTSSESESDSGPNVDRRRGGSAARDARGGRSGVERRQFGSSHTGLSGEGRELAAAIDAYKLEHRRRYITCDEMLVVLSSLGYSKSNG
ncbi:hypothetical protein [Neorhodopirellula pilleata]|uniref:Uncharacterized protein n=1 Tax=Neorhodopirellula pilleata TaxID=2714738 RepID=A0A5C6A5L9_9BACT|nr:hypothetical protein [Neorhodopirellula pilleata]TWT94361.1 hypothetical protein Pla100_39730 [Neorhodopirellula pilleata]